ncbi:MAG: 1-deoxy-D-xylulose-5-phosphate synthase [Arenicellaceae bacterium]|nr:1-deoxy-D-xylulose-5-phosphate synthase [Arenicellaceae bacterium]
MNKPISTHFELLSKINSPADLRKLEQGDLKQVCEETRGFLIETLARVGGHFAAGLGAVEVTAALHYVFNTPNDRIVWDIGHQAYPHKILTGRRDQLHTIRKPDGLSPFLKREESVYDTFGAGHSSTSISAALGMAVAAASRGEDRDVVAVIGDGALTAGMAYEALNNAGDMDANLLVILNDNDMSISPNVGALRNYLARLLSGKAYTGIRKGAKGVLQNVPPFQDLARRWEEHMKGMVMPGTLFEELGFYYIGPVDGHDIDALVKTLQNLKALDGPRFLHIVTQKGKGFEPAEGDPLAYHGVSPFNPQTGEIQESVSKRTYTHVFSDWLCDMAEKDTKLMGITPAMREGSGLVKFSQQYPDRYFDVGIAEQHAVTFAAGIACEGLKPVVAIYSTFLQRAYDQLVHDVSVQNLDVTFAIDRAGLVGADGATHAGSFDYSFMRCLPNMLILAPSDEAECRNMLYTAYQHQGPSSVRYPRGSGTGTKETTEMTAIPIGQGEISTKGNNIAILSFGALLPAALGAALKLGASVANMRFIKPLDEQLILDLAKNHSLLITLEENTTNGGAGSGVNEFLASQSITTPIINLGLPDSYIEHGLQTDMLTACGLDASGIIKSAHTALHKHGIKLTGVA